MTDKILCFGAILVDDPAGTSDLREVRVYYHLEDETVRVVEVPTPNSGTVQGTLVGRQRVSTGTHPLAPHLTLHHLKVGEHVRIAGRLYLVRSCDAATRTYLTSLGLAPLPDLVPHPIAAITTTPSQVATGKVRFSGDWPRQHPLATFVRNAGQVLRFYGEWADEGRAMGGVTTPVTERVELRYYLEDDTGEVRLHQLTPHQDALTPAPPHLPLKILKRAPIPKDLSQVSGAAAVGALGRPTLNLVGLKGSRAHLKDRRPQARGRPAFVGPEDLVLGNTVPVCGRLLKLCECDHFTTNYYSTVLGVEQCPAEYQYLRRKLGVPQVPRSRPLDPRWLEEPPRDPNHPLPTSVTTLVGGKHARSIRDGCEHTILRFGAKLLTDEAKDEDREFVVSFYLHDSTISVYEVPKINSGMRAGMFLGRGLVVAQGGQGHVSGQDLYAGATVALNAHVFHLSHADEFTLTYMDQHADEFPQANYNVALDEARRCLGHHQLTALLQQMASHDPGKTGFVPTSQAVAALSRALSGSTLSLQMRTALARRHRRLDAAPLARKDLTHLAALHLKRNNFDGLQDLRSGLRQRDVEGRGHLPARMVRAALVATRLPLTTTLTDALVNSVTQEDGEVEYGALCDDLDWRLRPHIHDNLPCQVDEASLVEGLRRAVDLVNYMALIADLEGSANTHHHLGGGSST
ncbi:EF-hand domain-containing family member C2-like [Panulirus ornatus]|uniref:EF-hand domain-containing family member C2-like n=1 Tax=Panulirus ornatus TaxID=150431 RepID=UPI003A8C5F56